MIFINGLRVRVGNEFINGCIDPYNPLGLPPYTIRVKFKSGYTPTMGDAQTLVDANENVWDIYNDLTRFATHNGIWEKDDNRRGGLKAAAVTFLGRKRDIKKYVDIF